jgi:GT2 family glycosyltransferase
MAQVDTRTRTAQGETERLKPPRVLVVLVTHNGAAWLPQCLAALARQTHPRIAIVGVDNGSSDGSSPVLEAALGPERVLKLEQNLGFAAAVAKALESPGSAHADFILLLHDDTILAPTAITAMLDSATRVDGVGVVGPKVLDWEDPTVLQEIGLSTDRFGYPYSPLEDGEIDQGQYDRIREVRFVSSCAMLISRAALDRVGPLDERFTARFEDLDFCWRAQLAGFRVLMTPKAVVCHRGATRRHERTESLGRQLRYERERAAVVCILKNYGLLSLLWVLPLYVVQGGMRVALLVLTRRFGDAYEVLAAWGWNLSHLPGTLRRRIRVQAVRATPDRSIRRSMAPTAYRLRRWGATALQSLTPKPDAADGLSLRPGVRSLGYASAHPVVVTGVATIVLAAIAYRHLAGAQELAGGGLATFPSSPEGFFRELVSGLRHTGLGGSHAASPALGLLGIGSVLTLGSPALLQKLLLLLLPVGAGAACYRAVRSLTAQRLPSAVAGACYGLSSVVLWALSQGRLGALVLLAGLPWLSTKIPQVFDVLEGGGRAGAVRWVAGTAIGLAVLGSFFPGVILAVAVLAACALVSTKLKAKHARGLGLIAAAALLAGLLTFPWALDLIRAGPSALSDPAGSPSFASLGRLVLGAAPGSWPVAFYLPAAALLALVFVSGRHAVIAVRAALAALASLYLAWLAAAGYLPLALSNPTAYVALAAFSYALLVGLGLASLTQGVARFSFGHRQVSAGIMALVVGVGVLAQAAQAGRGAWAVGPDRVPPAYPIVGQPSDPFRVLWLGRPTGRPFPAPGGLPQGVVEAGRATVRFAVTAVSGSSALDTGRPLASGPGYERLRAALGDILAGSSGHGGALLAPFAIRYVVAAPGDLPSAALFRLRRQLDLDQVTANGLTIFHDPLAVPVAGEIAQPQWAEAALAPSPEPAPALPAPHSRPLGSGFTGGPSPEGSGLVLLSQQFDPRWRLTTAAGRPAPPAAAFGWAVGFRPPATATFTVRFEGQRTRTIQILLLVLLWASAVWFVRKPVRG